MNVKRQNVIAFIRAALAGDREKMRGQALCLASSSPETRLEVESLFGQRASALHPVIPHDLAAFVRALDPWVAEDELELHATARRLLDRVCREHAARPELEVHGLAPQLRVLLHGPSGTGKTSLVSAVARKAGLPLYEVPMDAVVASYMGESSNRIRKSLEWALTQDAVVLLDELDAVATSRGRHNEVGEQTRIVNTLLVVLDGMRRTGKERAIVFATTNMRAAIDVAVARRFDVEHETRPPSQAEAVQLWQAVFERAGLVAPCAPYDVVTSAPSHAAVERAAKAHARDLVLGGAVS